MHVGVEMGGTSCKVAIFKDNDFFKPMASMIFETSKTNAKVTLDQMSDWIDKSLGGQEAASLGITAFGPICLDRNDSQFGNITTTPKLAWQNIELLKHFKTRHNFENRPEKIFFDTDCNVCAMYEYQQLKQKDMVRESLCYVTAGTGIGIGLIINGKCVHGVLHPEGGHVVVPRLERDLAFKGSCSFHGDCLEGLCTNNAIRDRLGLASVEAIPKLPDSHDIWNILADYFGSFCANIFLTTSVEKIIMGGGIFNRNCLLEKTRE